MTQIIQLSIFTLIILLGAFVLSHFKEDKHNGTKYVYYTFIFLFCFGYGYMEYELLRQHGSTGEKWILEHFSTYHAIMAYIFILVSMTSLVLDFRRFYHIRWQGWRSLPLMILVEDLSYRLAKGEWVTADDWISWKFGGISFPDFYFPFTYIFLILAALVFYNIGFIVYKIKLTYRIAFLYISILIDRWVK